MPGAVDGNGVEHRISGTGVRLSAAAFCNGEHGVLGKRLSFNRMLFGHNDPDGIIVRVTEFMGGNAKSILDDLYGKIAVGIAVNVIDVPSDYFLFPFGGLAVDLDVRGNVIQIHRNSVCAFDD